MGVLLDDLLRVFFRQLLQLLHQLGVMGIDLCRRLGLVIKENRFMFVCSYVYDGTKAVPMSFGLSLAVTIFAFTLALIILEWKERKGADND